MKADGATAADNGEEEPSSGVPAEVVDAGNDAGNDQDGATPMLDPDVKPRRKEEERRGSGRRKERRRADSKDRGGQHHQV